MPIAVDPLYEQLEANLQKRRTQLQPFQNPQPAAFAPKLPTSAMPQLQLSQSQQFSQQYQEPENNLPEQPGLNTQAMFEKRQQQEPRQFNNALPPSIASLAQKYGVLNWEAPTGNEVSSPYLRQLGTLKTTRDEIEAADEARANYKKLEAQTYARMQQASIQNGITIGGTLLSPAAQKQADSIGQRILRAGERFLGQPYVFGGLDCSYLVQAAYRQVGIRLPRVSKDQAKSGKVLSLSQARPGDIVVMNSTLGKNRHVAIYAGNGRLLEAPRTGKNVGYYPIGNRHVNFVVRPY